MAAGSANGNGSGTAAAPPRLPESTRAHETSLAIVFIAATTLLGLLTGPPIWRHEAWWVRSLDFPRLQLGVASLVLALTEAVVLDLSRPWTWVLLAAALICLAYHLWWILPYTRLFPVDNLYGMHVYSRYPLSDSRTEFLVEPDVPSMHTRVHLPSGAGIRVHFLHPAPPSPTESDASSERDAELIIVARSVADTRGPVIVTGDLNDVAWSETTRLFRKISGLLDPRVGRGMFNTFHARYRFLRWPLDHLFRSGHFRLSRIGRLPDFGSDHFALLTELVFDPRRGDRTTDLEADAQDRAWADAPRPRTRA